MLVTNSSSKPQVVAVQETLYRWEGGKVPPFASLPFHYVCFTVMMFTYPLFISLRSSLRRTSTQTLKRPLYLRRPSPPPATSTSLMSSSIRLSVKNCFSRAN